jgi:hypothetical protein
MGGFRTLVIVTVMNSPSGVISTGVFWVYLAYILFDGVEAVKSVKVVTPFTMVVLAWRATEDGEKYVLQPAIVGNKI